MKTNRKATKITKNSFLEVFENRGIPDNAVKRWFCCSCFMLFAKMIGLQVFISTDTNHSKTKKKQSWQAETYEDLNKTQHFRLP